MAFERVKPNGITETTNNWGTTGDYSTSPPDYQDIDEDYQGTYDLVLLTTDDTSGTGEAKIDFATPTATPVATTDAQAIRVAIYKSTRIGIVSSIKNDPTFDLWVYDGSSEVQLANDVSLSGYGTEGTPYENSFPFTYNGGSDGSEVYVRFISNGNGQTGTNARVAGLETIEWYAETGTGSTPKSGSDTVTVGVTEGTPTMLGTLSAADSPTVSLAEAVSLLAVLTGTDDPLSVSLSELASISAPVSGSDDLTVSLVDSSSLLGALGGADTLSLSITDTSALSAVLAGADTLTLSLIDVGSLGAVAKAASDSLGCSLTEAAALIAAMATSGQLNVSLSDVQTLGAALAGSDSTVVSLIEVVGDRILSVEDDPRIAVGGTTDRSAAPVPSTGNKTQRRIYLLTPWRRWLR